jgi:hypothetical protein
MNLRRGNECTGPAPPFDNAFTLQSGQSVPRGHQADFVYARQLPLGSHHVAGIQLPGFNPLPDGILDALIRRHSRFAAVR